MAPDERRVKATEEEKRRMRRLGEDLREFESNTVIEGERLRELIRQVNEKRAEMGIPPLDSHDIDDIPEVGLHERARALGLVKPGGSTPRRGQ